MLVVDGLRAPGCSSQLATDVCNGSVSLPGFSHYRLLMCAWMASPMVSRWCGVVRIASTLHAGADVEGGRSAHAVKTPPPQPDVTAVTPYDGVCTAWRGPPELCRYTYELCLSWSKPEGLGLGLRLRCAFLPSKPRERRALSGPIAYGCSMSGRLMPAVYYV